MELRLDAGARPAVDRDAEGEVGVVLLWREMRQRLSRSKIFPNKKIGVLPSPSPSSPPPSKNLPPPPMHPFLQAPRVYNKRKINQLRCALRELVDLCARKGARKAA